MSKIAISPASNVNLRRFAVLSNANLGRVEFGPSQRMRRKRFAGSQRRPCFGNLSYGLEDGSFPGMNTTLTVDLDSGVLGVQSTVRPFDPGRSQGLTSDWTPEPRSRVMVKTKGSTSLAGSVDR